MNTKVWTFRGKTWVTWCAAPLAVLLAGSAAAQFSSGSDGSDGVLNPATDLVIDMADHPDGIYQYESVNIPEGVTVSFVPNAQNTPVVWLVQGACTIDGTVTVSGQTATNFLGAIGGPGGYRGGSSSKGVDGAPESGHGPGAGRVTMDGNLSGSPASHATLGGVFNASSPVHTIGGTYGNSFLQPLIGGSGGSGGARDGDNGGGGGGGALLIAADTISMNGIIRANGGAPRGAGGPGSGGAIRIVSPVISGTGLLQANGADSIGFSRAGIGRIRFEGNFMGWTGETQGATTGASAPGIIMLPEGLLPALSIDSVAGLPVRANPTGLQSDPDVEIPLTVSNPVDVVISCANVIPGTEVTLDVLPLSGPKVSVSGVAEGTMDASSLTVTLDLPEGEGTMSASTINGVVPAAKSFKTSSLRETGLAPNGEPFEKVMVTASLSGAPVATYITPSGARYTVPLGE